MGVIEASDRAWKAVQMKGEKQGVSAWLRGIIDEWEASGTQSCCAMAKKFGVVCKHEKSCRDCMVKMMTAIADRIDAERALPADAEWPRFEDGGLVRIGDELEFEGKTMLVCDATFYADGWALWCDREDMSGRLYGKYGERPARPAPKVLDADGAPIKVDDTVWMTYSGCKRVVKAVCSDECTVEYEEGGWDYAKRVAHEPPTPEVLDADGVPIKVGDDVYFVADKDGSALTVECIDVSGEKPVVDLVYSDERGSWHLVNPEKLTHERPDSWRLWGEELDMAVKVGEVDKVEMMRRAKALAKATAKEGE